MSDTLSRAVRDLLWRVVGVAVGAIGYAAQAGGFELEMRRAATRQDHRSVQRADEAR